MKADSINGPLVSILIPCHDSADMVAAAIDSALAQTYPGVEVVVIDDGSRDESAAVLSRYGDRIRWRSIPNGGASAARNEALRMAKGEFIQFLDADDLLMPGKIECQLPVLIDGDVDLVFCRATVFGDGRSERPQSREIDAPDGVDPFVYCLRQRLGIPAPLYRRNLLDQIGGFRAGVQFAEELDLHTRLAAAGARILFLDELLCRLRISAGDARVRTTARPAGAHLRFILELTEELMRRPHYKMNPQRCRALASLIGQHAISAYRNGARRLPVHAFQLARQLDPHFAAEEHPWYRAAVRGVGHMNTERILAFARNFRERMHFAAS